MDNGEKEQLYCICRTSVANVFMIMCDYCFEWYHGDCVGVTLADAEKIDKYCCADCQISDKSLRTTYKKSKAHGKSRRNGRSSEDSKASKTVKRVSKSGGIKSVFQNAESPGDARSKTSTNVKRSAKSVEGNRTVQGDSESKTSQTVQCKAESREFGFVDTTSRRAKSEAYRKIKSENEQAGPTGAESAPRQCYGPGCTSAGRAGSKYCSDRCGVALATHRILEVLPARVRDFRARTPAAEERDQRRLADIRRDQRRLELEVEQVDAQIVELVARIRKTKLPGNAFADPAPEDPAPVDCPLCGAEAPARGAARHLEACYRRLERRVVAAEVTSSKPEDDQWNVFCNRQMSRNTYCKKLRVLCPFHYRDRRREGEVCGFPGVSQAVPGGGVVHCGNAAGSCPHPGWEEAARAQLDLQKLLRLLRYNQLQREKGEVRRRMAARGDVLSLMLNQTIVY